MVILLQLELELSMQKKKKDGFIFADDAKCVVAWL